MVYDEVRGVSVLFGGDAGGDETWEWDGSDWTMVANTEPRSRYTHAMSYDKARQKFREQIWGGVAHRITILIA